MLERRGRKIARAPGILCCGWGMCLHTTRSINTSQAHNALLDGIIIIEPGLK